MHNSFDICTCRCDPFFRLDKSTILQFLLSVIFGMSFMFFNLLFKKATHIEMKVWGKATETAVDIKIPRGTSAVKFSVKLLPANIGCVNYSGLKFSPDFQNTEPAFWRSSTEVVVQHYRYTNADMKILQGIRLHIKSITRIAHYNTLHIRNVCLQTYTLKSSLLFKKNTNFTGEELENF